MLLAYSQCTYGRLANLASSYQGPNGFKWCALIVFRWGETSCNKLLISATQNGTLLPAAIM